MATGIEERHSKICRSRDGGRCNCTPAYRAHIYDGRTGQRVRKTFPTRAAAKTWRTDMADALRRGELRALKPPTLEEAVADWLAKAEQGVIRTRGRKPFKPATIRAVRQHYTLRLRDRLGSRRIDDLSRFDVQDLIDELDAEGVNPSTIEGTVLPLRLVFRHARMRGYVSVDPTDAVELPAKSRGQRTPPAPADAAALLDALPEDDRALWATAMLAGLRRGELMALRWQDIDCRRERRPACCASRGRTTLGPAGSSRRRAARVCAPSPSPAPSPPTSESICCAPAAATGSCSAGPQASRSRPGPCRRAPTGRGTRRKLPRVTLHACRHLFASASIAAGVNAHALCKYMGHSSIQVTFDLYGHLFPGNEAEAAGLLDAYLEREFVAAT